VHVVASSIIIHKPTRTFAGDHPALLIICWRKKMVVRKKMGRSPCFLAFEADIPAERAGAGGGQGGGENLQMGKVKKKGAKGPLRKQKGWEAADWPAGDQAELERHPPPDTGAQPLQLFSKKVREEASEPQQQGMEAQEQAAPRR
jgi:hypothetical protein